MARVSKHEAIGVATALVVVFGFLFFGNYIFQKAAPKEKTQAASSVTANSQDAQTSGVQDTTLGNGPAVKSGDTVSVNYIGTLVDGTKFDSSYDRGEPISFTVGSGQLIKGFDEGVVGMQVGGKRKLTIPPELGYGAQAVGPIPANSTIIFEVELVKIGK